MTLISNSQGLVTDEEVVFLLDLKNSRNPVFLYDIYEWFDLEEMEESEEFPDIEVNHVHLSVSQEN